MCNEESKQMKLGFMEVNMERKEIKNEFTTKKDLTYTDEDGNKMYGYSQVNLDKIHKVLWFLALIFTMFLALVIFIVWKSMQWGIVGKFIDAIGAC